MPRITLPDGSVREYDHPVTPAEVASSIGAGLAKAAIGAKIDGVLSDLNAPIQNDANLALITAIDRKTGESSDDALFLIRHSAAHVMAEAIQKLFPGTQLVYGPPVDQGFYYDIFVSTDDDGRAISTEDFDAIEKEMANIISEDRPFTRYELIAPKGIEKLLKEGNKYKVDNANRAIRAEIEALGESFQLVSDLERRGGRELEPQFWAEVLKTNPNCHRAKLSFYVTGTEGKHFEDLCRGPHVPSTGRIGAFKVTSLASAYWHGDATSDSLTRVYGTAFADQKQLDRYLDQLEEAKKRDHRVLGKRLKLFHVDEAVGQGLILWTPNGAVVRQELQTFISEELRKQGYHQVFTPHIGKLDLYRTSGHFPYYQDSQFTPIIEREQLAKLADEGCACADLASALERGDIDGYLLKPMNCPHHIKIYDSEPHSYRDLPVRLAEFGTVYRWEQSGEVGGLTRVRCFTQDDAHLFCTEEQVEAELLGCLDLVKIIFRTLGMEEYRVRVGLRDLDSDKYVGNPANWEKAEEACRRAAASLGVRFSEEPGEAAFYGPKIDFVVKDVVGREWQLGTVQVDYNLPERFDLTYIGPDNKAHRPVMIHRAPFGSMERFIGVLIEHFAGAFPTWLSPEQVRVLPVSDPSVEYARGLVASLKAQRVRASVDDSGERINAKVKVAADMKVPYLLIVGAKEAEAGTVSVRARGTERDLGAVPFEQFAEVLGREIHSRGEASVLRECFGTKSA